MHTMKLYLIAINILLVGSSYGQNIGINPTPELNDTLMVIPNQIVGKYAMAVGGTANIALGNYTTVSGHHSIAYSYGEWVGGLYNTPYYPISQTSWEGLDRIFVIGNGQSDSLRSNALTIYKNGIININDAYSLPNVDGLTNQILVSNGLGIVQWQSIEKLLPTSNSCCQLPSFTPNSTIDTRGQVGDMSWDDNFIYIKTNTGWKRSSLSTF